MPRLTDGGYDLVFVDADKENYRGYVEQAVRLLRPGGVLVVDNALWHDRVADPARRDETTTTIREVGRIVRADDRLLPSLLPVGRRAPGGGQALAGRREAPLPARSAGSSTTGARVASRRASAQVTRRWLPRRS